MIKTCNGTMTYQTNTTLDFSIPSTEGMEDVSPEKKKLINRETLWGLGNILLASICSYLLMCLILPELFVTHEVSFIRHSDTEFNYQGVFALINNFYHGGIQLWNMYDQMSLAYQHLTGGLYNFNSLMTVAAYILFSPLFKSDAAAFHVLFSTVFFASSFLLRGAGAYLLVRRFSSNQGVLFISGVMVNTLLVAHMHAGLGPNCLYSFFPLLVHFILRFLEEVHLRDFLLSVLTLTLAVASDPMQALGYFYQGIHFVIVPALIWALFSSKSALRSKISELKNWATRVKFLNRRQLSSISGVFLICVLLMAPNVYMLKVNFKDYEVAQETSRFNDMLSVKKYFDRPIFVADQKEFLWRLIDFSRNKLSYSWVYFGYLTIFLSAVGLALGRDSRKYIFLGSILLFWLINSPRDAHGLSGLAHLLNAFTNPFKAIPRSFHMTSFLTSFLFLPLVGLGLQSIWDHVSYQRPTHRFRVLVAGMILLIFFGLVYGQVSFEIKRYLFRGGCVSLGILAILFLNPTQNSEGAQSTVAILSRHGFYKIRNHQKMILVGLLLIVLFMMDGSGMRRYLKYVADHMKKMPHKIEGLESLGYVDVDDRNPKLMPRRDFFTMTPIGQVKGYLQTDSIGMQGLYFQFTYFLKYFIPATNYKPRHKSYAKWPEDQEMLEYLKRNTRLLFFASHAVAERPGLMTDLLAKGWERAVVMISDAKSDENNILKDLPAKMEEIENKDLYSAKVFSQSVYEGIVTESDIQDALYLSFDLPADFPKEMTSTIFTSDRQLLRAMLGKDQNTQWPLSEVQGKPYRPFTFDIGNWQSRRITMLLSKNMLQRDYKLILQYPTGHKTGIMNVWENQSDNFGFDYFAANDGWLVFHYPYDPKWQMNIDYQPVKIYRANKSFIGVPIRKGMHKILLQYWPDTCLRSMIFLSIVLSFASLLGVVGLGLRDPNHLEKKFA